MLPGLNLQPGLQPSPYNTRYLHASNAAVDRYQLHLLLCKAFPIELHYREIVASNLAQGPVFFTQLGTIKNPFLIGLVTTLVNMLSTPASFVMVEKIGRRPILIFGAAGMVIMQFIVAIIGATAGKNTADHPANPNATRAMIAFICLNISVFATTWGPAAWIVIGEIFPLTIRSRGVGLSTGEFLNQTCVNMLTLTFEI